MGVDPREGDGSGLEGEWLVGYMSMSMGIWRKRGMEVLEDYKIDSVLPGQVMLGIANSCACSSSTTCSCRF